MPTSKTTLAAVLLAGTAIAAIRVIGSPGAPEQPSPDTAPTVLLGPRADDVPPEPPAAAQLPAEPPAADKAPAPPAKVAPPRPAPKRPAPTGRRAGGVAVPVSTPEKQGQVWIDPYEVTVDQYKACVDAGACKPDWMTVQESSPCNYGAPGRGDHPMNCVSFHGAEAYCRWSGERLCTEDEWFAGCRGPAVQDYPYGQSYVEGACVSIPREGVDVASQRTAPVGAATGCEGGYKGLFDMVGNVSEWVDSCKDDYCHFYGGAFLENNPAEEFASCKRMCAGNQKSFRSSTIGFRCCADSPPR